MGCEQGRQTDIEILQFRSESPFRDLGVNKENNEKYVSLSFLVHCTLLGETTGHRPTLRLDAKKGDEFANPGQTIPG